MVVGDAGVVVADVVVEDGEVVMEDAVVAGVEVYMVVVVGEVLGDLAGAWS